MSWTWSSVWTLSSLGWMSCDGTTSAGSTGPEPSPTRWGWLICRRLCWTITRAKGGGLLLLTCRLRRCSSLSLRSWISTSQTRTVRSWGSPARAGSQGGFGCWLRIWRINWNTWITCGKCLAESEKSLDVFRHELRRMSAEWGLDVLCSFPSTHEQRSRSFSAQTRSEQRRRLWSPLDILRSFF